MTPLLTMKRLRLEVDRTLRTRTFFSHALRDELEDEAYADLLAQLGHLIESLGEEEGRDLAAAAERDRERLSHKARRRAEQEQRCAATRLFDAARSQSWTCLPEGVALDAGLAVLGTSWTLDAEESITRRSGRACEFLGELGAQGPRSLERLTGLLDPSRPEAQVVCAFAELTRGALLGVATELDSRWPSCFYLDHLLEAKA